MKNQIVVILFIFVCLSFVTSLNAETKEGYDYNKYAYQIMVEPQGESSLQKITLPEEIYWFNKNNTFSEFYVFDSKGLAMPFEVNPITSRVKQAFENEIKFYPLFEKQSLANQTEDIFFNYNEQQQLEHIEKNKETKKEPLIVGYILDQGEKRPSKISELEFLFSEVGETSFLHLNIDQSDDLRNWTRLSGNEVLAQLFHQQDLSLHNKIFLSGVKHRYLRLSITDQSVSFEITAIKQKYSASQATEQILWKTIQFIKKPGENFMLAEVPASVSLQHLKFELTQQFSFLNGQLFYKVKPQTGNNRVKYKNKQDWQNCCEINLYQIKDGSNLLIKNQIDLNGTKTQSLKLILDYPPIVEQVTEQEKFVLNAQIGWKAESLIFLAAGEAPYYIVTGSDKKTGKSDASSKVNQNQNPIIANIKKQLTTKIPEAKILSTKINQEKLNSDLSEISWSKIILWLILFAGVALMLWMARNLLKQIGKES